MSWRESDDYERGGLLFLANLAKKESRRGGRAVEGARLEIVYTVIPYRGFESLSLRHISFSEVYLETTSGSGLFISYCSLTGMGIRFFQLQ